MHLAARNVLKLIPLALLAIFMGLLIAMSNVSGIFISGSSPVKDTFVVLALCAAMVIVISRIRVVSKILIVGLAFRLLLALSISYYGVLPYAFDTQWDELAQLLVGDWHNGYYHLDFESSNNVKLYTYVNFFVYLLLGYNPIFMQLLNVFFGTLTIFFVYKIAVKLFNEQVARKAAWIMAFLPSHIMFSAMNMRDALSTLLMAALIYQFVLWRSDGKQKNLLGYLFWFVPNVLIRIQNAALLFVVTGPFVLKTFLRKTNPHLRPIVLMGAMICLAGIIGAFYKSGMLNYVSFEYISREMQYRSDGGTQYLSWMSYHNWFDMLVYMPIRSVYFLFSPFPWDVKNASQALAAIENLILIFMALKVVRRWKHVRNTVTDRKILISIVIIFVLGVAANALADGNSGTAIRHKLQYIYLLAIFYCAATVNKDAAPKAFS